jgi:hypothetical protein
MPALFERDPLISARIDATLAWVLVNEDLDLLIELIIAATVLRKPWSPYVWLGWHLFNEVWDELGFLPSPSLKPSEFAALKGDAATAYAFRHVYHTAYVAGLLCSILLTRDLNSVTSGWENQRIPAMVAADSCSAAVRKARAFTSNSSNGTSNGVPQLVTRAAEPIGRVTALVAEMIPDHLYWRKVLPKVDIDSMRLAQVLGDSAIIHAARRYDLPKLLIALDAMITLPLTPSLTVVEGALFLVRQQLHDGCIGSQFVAAEMRRSTVAVETTHVVSDCLEAYAARFANGV